MFSAVTKTGTHGFCQLMFSSSLQLLVGQLIEYVFRVFLKPDVGN